MAALINHTRFNTLQDTETLGTLQIGVHQGRSDPLLFRVKESASHCFQKTKDCFSLLYGPPYPPLSTREVSHNYWTAAGSLYLALCIGGVTTYYTVLIAENYSKATGSPSVPMTGLAFVDAIACGTVIAGIRMIHKTCIAPRLGENQDLLPD